MIKNWKYWLAALTVLSACTVEKPYEEMTPEEPFYASIEGSGTRTYVDGTDEEILMHWTAQDAITIFTGDYGDKYVFQGATGDRGGKFAKEDASTITAGFEASRYYAVYPYASTNQMVADGQISVVLPSVQTYVPGSFGLGAAWMTAATASMDDRHLTFKNVMGFLKLQIYGGAKIDKIVFRGNDGEKISGAATITAAYGAVPSMTVSGDGTSLQLDCGNVETGAKKADATAFWLAVPPMTFSKGFTVVVTDNDGNETTKTLSTSFEVQRNVVTPMTAFKVEKKAPPIPDLPAVNSTLPVIYIYTPDAVPIVSKDVWIEGSWVYLKDADGKVTDLGAAQVRGRGNTTWNFDKKPYTFKLDKKASILGMPKDKRWNLLANFVDRTRLRNDVALELGRRLGPDHDQSYIDWTPRGKFVELVLNGEHMGNYYLVEHIKIASDRVPITEMKSTDIAEPEITGGYLLEMSIEMDEVNKFYTNGFPDTYPYKDGLHGGPGGTYKLPVMIKDPDEDVLVPAQFDWIKNYINTLQSNIVYNKGGWTGQVDMDSFICWMFIQEIVGNYEPFHPKSSYMHKHRDGKLVMGPLWDFDYGTFRADWNMTPIYHYAIWYPYMLRNSTFKARVKELYPIVRPLLRDVANNYVDARAAEIKASVEADWDKWPTTNNVNGDINKTFDAAVAALKGNLNRRLDQMTNEVNNM